VLTDLLGADVALQTAKLNIKAPGGGMAVEWHQDWALYPHTNDDLLAVGVMVDDVDEENGPLQVIPGSHRGPILDHSNPDGVFCGKPSLQPRIEANPVRIPLPLSPESGSIFKVQRSGGAHSAFK